MQASFNTSNVPYEIWLRIFAYATTSSETLARISSVCKEWYHLAQDSSLLPLPLKHTVTKVGQENNFFVKDSIKTPNLTISHLYGDSKELISVRLTTDNSHKMISLDKPLDSVRSIEIIGNSHLGIITHNGLRVYNIGRTEPIHRHDGLEQIFFLRVTNARSANGLAYFHGTDRKIYIYREEEGQLDIMNIPFERKGFLSAVALQKDYLATVVATYVSKEKKGTLKKIRQAVADKFIEKKLSEVMVRSTKMVIYPLNGKDSPQEIPLQQDGQLSADKSYCAVQNTDKEVMVVNIGSSITYTIPHKRSYKRKFTSDPENKFFLKDNYLVTISFEEKLLQPKKGQ